MSRCRADACNEGRRPCPCPDACHLPDAFDRPLNWRKVAVYVACLALVLWAVVIVSTH